MGVTPILRYRNCLSTYLPIYLSTMKISSMGLVTILVFYSCLSLSHGGPAAYGLCQTGCNTVWVACVAAAGGTAGVSTGGAGVPAAILACNAANGVCMATCAGLLLTPTP